MLVTMCSAIFFRMTPIFSMRTFSPGVNAGGGASGAAARRLAPRPASAGAAVAAAALDEARMSFLVTRPEIPVPFSCAMSMPCSFAILRTSGDGLACGGAIAESSAGAGGRDR